jgi:hypothetical protein
MQTVTIAAKRVLILSSFVISITGVSQENSGCR